MGVGGEPLILELSMRWKGWGADGCYDSGSGPELQLLPASLPTTSFCRYSLPPLSHVSLPCSLCPPQLTPALALACFILAWPKSGPIPAVAVACIPGWSGQGACWPFSKGKWQGRGRDGKSLWMKGWGWGESAGKQRQQVGLGGRGKLLDIPSLLPAPLSLLYLLKWWG